MHTEGPAQLLSIRPGMRLRTRSGGTEVLVVRAPQRPVDLRCAGDRMAADRAAGQEPAGDSDPATSGVLVGKRYTDPAGELELLCIKPGRGPLTLDAEELRMMAARELPSSD